MPRLKRLSQFEYNLLGGNVGRIRYVEVDGEPRTWLYICRTSGTGVDEHLTLIDVTGPRISGYLGGFTETTWGRGFASMPSLWPDDWPLWTAGINPYPGSGNSGGLITFEAGPYSDPVADPLGGYASGNSYGSISGGNVNNLVQKDNMLLWGSTFGFVQVTRLRYVGLNAYVDGEITWFGSSESHNPRRGLGWLCPHPQAEMVYSLSGTTLNFYQPETTPDTPPQLLGEGSPFWTPNGFVGLQDNDVIWKVQQTIVSSNPDGFTVEWGDVSDTNNPVFDESLALGNGMQLCPISEYQIGMTQCVWDRRYLFVAARETAGFNPTYILFKVDLVDRVLMDQWELEPPPGGMPNPKGSFITAEGFYGWWDTGQVILWGDPTVPPLRHKQRDDGIRRGAPSRNPPSSKQARLRSGWNNTYL